MSFVVFYLFGLLMWVASGVVGWGIVFDIAEKRKKAREAFRDMLEQLKCYPLQKSIFVHPYSCEAEIEIIKNIFHIPDWEVLYFSSDLIPRERFLKKKFKLL